MGPRAARSARNAFWTYCRCHRMAAGPLPRCRGLRQEPPHGDDGICGGWKHYGAAVRRLLFDHLGRHREICFSSDFKYSLAAATGLPVAQDTGLPMLPAGGFANAKELRNSKMNTLIPVHVESALSPAIYAYTREDSRRNLYRIQLP